MTMLVGMLWFDNDPKADLETKVRRAAAYYLGKYGRAPNLCFVHPKTAEGDLNPVDGVEIRTSRSVLPNHLWIGDDKAEISNIQLTKTL